MQKEKNKPVIVAVLVVGVLIVLYFIFTAGPKELLKDGVVQKTIAEFTVSNDQICLEDGKPIVYFFGADFCSHCRWEHPIVQEVAGYFGETISFHDNMNNNGKDVGVFTKYSPAGNIPALIIGCKYYRIGTVEPETAEGALQAETNFISLICQLTNNLPEATCQK